MKFPQAFQLVEQAQKNQNDPMALLNQITKAYSPEQMTTFLNTAKQMGVPNDVLERFQSGIKAK